MHGGAAKQVRAAREARIIEMKAELEAAKNSQPYERRHPAQVLLDAVLASDVVLTHMLHRRAAGELTPEESTALGWAIDRATRTSKTALDASLDARLLEFQEVRLQRSAEDVGASWLGLLVCTLRAARLSATTKLEVWRAWYGVAREILREKTELPRVGAGEVQAFARELEQAAAAEEEAAAIEPVDVDDDSELADDVSLLWPRGDGAA